MISYFIIQIIDDKAAVLCSNDVDNSINFLSFMETVNKSSIKRIIIYSCTKCIGDDVNDAFAFRCRGREWGWNAELYLNEKSVLKVSQISIGRRISIR